MRKILKVLNIPPLETVISEDARLNNELKKKEKLIESLKKELENKWSEEYNTHVVEIDKYKTKEEKMKKVIAKKEKMSKIKRVEMIKTPMIRRDKKGRII